MFCDVEDSAKLLRDLGDERYGEVLAAHHKLLRETFAAAGGIEVDAQGDAFFGVFREARDAVAAAAAAQRALAAHDWPGGAEVRVRMGLHTGEAARSAGGYVGHAAHAAARIRDVGHGGQVLVSGATVLHVDGVVPDGLQLLHLGEHRCPAGPRSMKL